MLCASVARPLVAFDFLYKLGALGSFGLRLGDVPLFSSTEAFEPCHIRPSSLLLTEAEFVHFLTFLMFFETYIMIKS
jgi:hypothetical protein